MQRSAGQVQAAERKENYDLNGSDKEGQWFGEGATRPSGAGPQRGSEAAPQVRLWDWPAGKEVEPLTLPATAGGITALAFSPDSKHFLTVAQPEGVVERWDTAALRRTERLDFLGGNHISLDLSSDGRWLAVADTNGLVQIWDYHARKLATDLVFPAGWLFVVGFSPNGRYLNAGAYMLDGSPLPRFWARPASRGRWSSGTRRRGRKSRRRKRSRVGAEPVARGWHAAGIAGLKLPASSSERMPAAGPMPATG